VASTGPASNEVNNTAGNDAAAVPPPAVAASVVPVTNTASNLAPAPLVASTPATLNNPANAAVAAPVGTVGGNPTQTTAQHWVPKYRNVGDAVDPFICPGLNGDCYHAVLRESGYWDHIFRKHHYTRKQLDKPENSHVRDVFVPARRASWYLARGHDITYQGTEPKQIAVRKRMALGLRSTDPEYAKTVYGSTMTQPDT
jgi:hypothetical protein